jgi:hypothetical protein
VAVLLAYGCVKGAWWPRTDRTSLRKGIALSVLVSVVLFALDSFAANALQVSPLSRILLEAGVFVVVYTGGLIALKPLTPQDLDLLRSALPPRFRSWLDPVQHWVT